MGFLEKRIEELEEETHTEVWPLGEQLQCCFDVLKVRTWKRVWPPSSPPIRYAVDRDFPGPVGSPYPATDREIRLLGALCRCYTEDQQRLRGEDGSEGEGPDVIECVREYLAEDKSIEECIADFTNYVSKLVTRMDPSKQPRREEQLYRLWRELNEP